MFEQELIIKILGLSVFVNPMLLVILLGVPTLLGRPLDERTTGRSVQVASGTGLLASLVILGLMLASGTRHVPIELGSWVAIPHYHFSVKLIFDRLSVPFVILTFILCGTTGAFATRYMHREPGFNRFFVLYALFLLGMVMTSLSGTIETLFAGWELVGLSSALLIGFFHERSAPVRNGLHVWVVYRISDAALLSAAVALHHMTGEGDFEFLLGTTPWPFGQAAVTGYQALLVGLLLLVAAAGKSSLVPFSGWLPRAMEGPTPSSAVFYGALSVHLGAFLLLRASPLLDLSPALGAVVVLWGIVTAVFAAYAGRVQSDIKCALSFASLSQVGIIVAEIGLGLRYVALIHMIGHGCLRTLQFVRAPTLLYDYRIMENAIGTSQGRLFDRQRRIVPGYFRRWIYLLAMERGYLDAYLTYFFITPFLRVFRWFDAIERRWTDFITGGHSRESERTEPMSGSFEELL